MFTLSDLLHTKIVYNLKKYIVAIQDIFPGQITNLFHYVNIVVCHLRT